MRFPDIFPGSVSFTRKPASPPQTIDALMARAKEIAARQSEQATGQYPGAGTVPGGIGHMFDRYFTGMEAHRTREEEALGRQELAQAMGGVNWDEGQASPETMQTIYGRGGLEQGLAVVQALAESRRAQREAALAAQQRTQDRDWSVADREDEQAAAAELAAQKDKAEGGPKLSDVATLADDFTNVPDVKNFQNAQSMWVSMQDAATRDTPQADLNMIIAAAKMFDPTSVVRTEEGKAVELTGDLPSSLTGAFSYLTGKPGARLGRNVRQGLMQEAYSRMNGYYRGVEEASKWFTDKATRNGFNPADIVRPFAAPVPFDLEMVVGSGGEPAGGDDISTMTDAEIDAEIARRKAGGL